MKAVLYGTYPSRQLERIKRHLTTPWDIATIFDGEAPELRGPLLAEADALVASVYRAKDPPISRARLLQCSSTGTDRLELAQVPAACAVCNVYGHQIAIAEYAIGAILDWSVGYRNLHATMREGTWSLDDWMDGPPHREAYGRTIGIVGFGRIGREVAVRAKALGMRVTALSAWRSAPPDRTLVEDAYAPAQWQAFASGLDFLVMTAPLGDDTRGMIDAAWFAAMKPHVVVINVGRGAVIDEQALYDALRERRIQGATIDVWYNYPRRVTERVAPSRFAFHELTNVVMTSHCSGRTQETSDRRFAEVAENLDALAAGKPLANVVRPAAS